MSSHLFDSDLYDSANLYLLRFGKLPSRIRITNVDYFRSSALLEKEFAASIIEKLESVCVTRSRKEEKEVTHYVMEGAVVLELSHSYCLVYHTPGSDTALIGKIRERLCRSREIRRRKPLEVNLVVYTDHGMRLNSMEIKRTRLDIGLYYEDDFREIDETIRTRLNRKKDKGIVLLHGAPGTGKTSYLRYLVGRIRKRIIFLPPEVAGRLGSPDLVKLLTDNPDSVLIVEDAENIIMQRQPGSDSAVSNLLNISDGLMSDFLNVQIICTFNSPVSSVDQALLRKGRLIARYEFGPLSVRKAQQLSDYCGQEAVISRPMTLAEIFNQSEKEHQDTRQLIGFRQYAH